MKKVVTLFLSLIILDVFAATCPNGYISYDYGANLLIDAQCSSGTTQIGDVPVSCDNHTECFADYLCNTGVSKINTSAGVTAPLYSQRLTAPSMNVANDKGECYTPLLVGKTSGEINVLYDDKVYHTTKLRQCMLGFNASVKPTGTYSQSGNRVDWSVTAEGRTIYGVSYCGKGKPESGSLTTSVVNTNTALESNDYCYCRITVPFLSDWWYTTRYTKYGAAGCDTYCYAQCVESIKSDLEMRTGLYNSMK
jgi:hypothetical protein